MSIGKLAAGALLALACSGCVTDAELRAADEARCRSFGFRNTSEGFANCLLQLDLNRAADRRASFDRFDRPPGWYYGRGWW